ncbi:MAG TPA: septal ring lytic transglycosylase RlpA family protein [Mycobacteriales bacterium]|nr:septal ring lytic transglycosylase RlpA family protein [Mycobacteriales bacterium]
MRARSRTAVTAALVAVLLPWPASGHAQPRPAVTSHDLPRLTAELARVTAHAQQLSQALDRAAARDGGLKVAFDRAQQAKTEAQASLDARVREVYMAGTPSPFGGWVSRMASPDLQELAHRGERAALEVDHGLVEAVTAQGVRLHALQRQAEQLRRRLRPQVEAVLVEQDRARTLLAQAEALAAAEHAAEVLRQLEAQRAALDEVSTATTLALTPGQTRRARRALGREEPVIRLLEASGSGYPAGYAPTGEVFAGGASWYGPGFVGNPTASGSPYDPERLTCAHKTLPLGTVVRVSRAGLAVSCLVNDRGPYVDGRVLDMSRAGSRALGYSGVAQVVVEVLAPV